MYQAGISSNNEKQMPIQFETIEKWKNEVFLKRSK